ncbi:MAG: response regulator [Candidatus Delongbacteria bacterium]|jgi:two-component system cell cycle sensor histidine kinase/response regulator CckA|nr:response regulator [Candidatus Delongbacteria bacterium]
MVKKKYNILVIDDTPKNIQVVGNFLKNEGYILSFATSGEEALNILSKEIPDIILLDVIMPEINGFELCKKIKETDRYKKIPVLFLTIKTDSESIIKGFESGGVDYITKPFNPHELLARIKTHLKLTDIQKELEEKNDQLFEEIHLRLKAEEKLKKINSEQESIIEDRISDIKRLGIILEQTEEDIIITDLEGNITYVNPAFERKTGYSSSEVIGKNPRLLKSGKQSDEIYKEMWDTIKNGKVWRGTVINKNKDGSFIEEDSTISPMRNHDNKNHGYFAVKRDMTEHNKMERQLRQSQKMEAIGTLAGGIAHDFNNILTAILGYTELAKMELPEENTINNKLSEVLRAGNRAKELVKQILTLSRKTEQELIPVRVDLIIKEAMKLLRASIPSIIEMKQDINTCHGTVMADPTQIHQIVMNLCTNSFHAMEEKGGILGVSLESKNISEFDVEKNGYDIKPGSYLRLVVSDSGVGIKKSDLERIFEPYYTTKKVGEGTGLGLAVIDGIVKNINGTISVYSELGKGTTFRILLPYNELEDEKIVEEILKEIPRGNENILFVDDEEQITALGKMILEDLGYSVTTMIKPNEALKLFRADPNKFDLVITDISMPGLTGIELSNEMQEIKPNIPIILSTGFSKLVSGVNEDSLSVKQIIMKPFLKRELAIAVREVLDN